jgi:hypothetical protein
MPLTILPSPQDVIPWVPASELTLTEQWPQDPPVFHAGEPLTRTLTLSAKGLTAAQLPPLGGMTVEAFKQYVDQPELDDQTADAGVTGVRREKIAFLPTQPGVTRCLRSGDVVEHALGYSRDRARAGARSRGAAGCARARSACCTSSARRRARERRHAGVGGAHRHGRGDNQVVWIVATVTLQRRGCRDVALVVVGTAPAQRARAEQDTDQPDARAARRQLQDACAGNDPVTDAARCLPGRRRWPV